MGWSDKYKKSIDCDNPKGFSQKAHCKARKKVNETKMMTTRKKCKNNFCHCKCSPRLTHD